MWDQGPEATGRKKWKGGTNRSKGKGTPHGNPTSPPKTLVTSEKRKKKSGAMGTPKVRKKGPDRQSVTVARERKRGRSPN